MMETSVFARLSSPLRLAGNKLFPFYELPNFLNSLAPEKIDIGFHRIDPEHSAINLALTFDPNQATNAIPLFKETLIRTEADLNFDCEFFSDSTTLFEDENWVGVEIEPDALALPSGKEIAITLPLITGAIDILRQAYVTDTPLCYRITIEQAHPDPATAKKLVPALAQLQSARNLAKLEEAVKEGFDLLRSGGWSVRERICIPHTRTAQDRFWIESLLNQYMKTGVTILPDDLWLLKWDKAQSPHTKESLQQIVASLRNANFINQMFAQIVPSDLSHIFAKALGDSRRAKEKPHLDSDYAFISYSHANTDFINQLLAMLDNAGIKYWYDSYIGAGSHWDEELETKIRNSGAVIACVSDTYQNSKYCKRELKFADLINKPIIPISEKKCTWTTGLQMMFQELQIAFFDNGHGFTDFHKTIRQLAPQIIV